MIVAAQSRTPFGRQHQVKQQLRLLSSSSHIFIFLLEFRDVRVGPKYCPWSLCQYLPIGRWLMLFELLQKTVAQKH